MTVHVVLLRGVNVGAHNRLSMPRLREVLAERGFTGVRTLLASGNVVLTSPHSPAAVAEAVHRVIADEWGLDIAVVMRTPAELRAALEADPIPDAAADPKQYRIRFLDRPVGDAFAHLDPAGFPGEHVHVGDREVYSWTPGGAHASRLARALGGTRGSLVSTDRNWDTVRALLALAES